MLAVKCFPAEEMKKRMNGSMNEWIDE